jgi:hypothetical protein
MKKWTEVSPYSGNPSMEEDAPANSNAGGGVSMPPDMGKKKHLVDRQGKVVDARTKAYKEHRARLEQNRLKRIEDQEKRSKMTENVVSKIIDQVYEAKSATGYEIYHKDYSSAMQHAYKFAKSKGYIVDPKDIDSKVATGPKKPSSGKTNSFILDTNKKQKVHIQVANLDNKRYELNMYID